MKYNHIQTATFLARPNRFLAQVLPDRAEPSAAPLVCHVKNTGRCRELLIPGARVILEHHPDALAAGRKTEYSLIGVYKEGAGFRHETQLVNMDSQAPNQAAWEWISSLPGISGVRREVRYGDSRFDLAYAKDGIPSFMEVKGVTLEQDRLAKFPDAPTERGIKHLHELAAAARDGYGASVLFVIQMKGIRAFSPNMDTHREFGIALSEAALAGVRILAYDCLITPDSMALDRPVQVILPSFP